MELSSPSAYAELRHLEECLWVMTARTGVSNYDFRLDAFFPCRRPWQPPAGVRAVARVGAVPHYDLVYDALRQEGITLLHDPEEYLRATELPRWYPLNEDLTPRSVWFPGRPDAAQVAAHFPWPVFVKGARQTSRHRRELSIVEGPEQFERVMAAYARDPILRSQGVVCREYVPLRPVEDADPGRIPSSFEFRTFRAFFSPSCT